MVKLKQLVLQKFNINYKELNNDIEEYFYTKLNKHNIINSNIWGKMKPILVVDYQSSSSPHILQIKIQIDSMMVMQLIYKVTPDNNRIKLISSVQPLKSQFMRNNQYGLYPYKMFKSNDIVAIVRNQIQQVNNIKAMFNFIKELI